MRASGIMLHISSLPNKYGFGCFSHEAYEFVDFLSESGFTYWQILPLNPTNESGSPFQSYSVFAGNPCFIDLTEYLSEKELLPLLKNTKNNTNENCENSVITENDALYENEVATNYSLNFSEIYNTRIELLRKVFEKNSSKINLEKFKKDNAFWLEDYAVFCALKDIYKKPYWKFPSGLDVHDKSAINEFKKTNQKQIDFYCFVQYLFFEQWQKLKEYANKKGIKIFGDLAFYPAGDSCDVWANKSDFCFDSLGNPKGIAGVPPDYFSKDGQLWGSPVYNIQSMKKNNYLFWTKRLEHAYNFFDVVRLDHFRGFESFWVVKDYKASNAKKGSWVKGLGLDFFKSLKNKKIPRLIAEDLGTITKDVLSLIKKLNIAGMKVFQFAFDGNPKNSYFPHNYNDNCVAYIGTHDNNTFMGFLNTEADNKTLSDIKTYLGQKEDTSNKEVLEMAFSVMLNSRAEIVILTMQDVLFLNEFFRMNKPGTVTNNWSFMLKPNYANKNLKDYLLKLNIIANRT